MNIVNQDEYKSIPSPWLYDFKKDIFDTYSRLCISNQELHFDNIPSDYQLIDELTVWCHEAASLFYFSDRNFYTTLDYNGVPHEMTPDDFYAEAMTDHYDPYVRDIYKAIESSHLSLFVEFKDEYINLPTVEVW